MSIRLLIANLVIILLMNMACTILQAPPIVFPILIALLLISLFITINTPALGKSGIPSVTPPPKPKAKALSKGEKDLEMAAQVQQGLMSVDPPHLNNIQIAKACHAAKNVGGDFYTFIYRDIQEAQKVEETPGVVKYIDTRSNYLGIAIADVAGHGLSSALVMALSAGITREVGYQQKSPATTLEKVNQNLYHLIKDTHVPYVTMAYGVIQPETLSFSYAKAGHCPILHQTKDGELHELACDGVFLGMYEDETYEELTCQLSVGDRLIFYTDGLTESRNPEGEFFGEERLKMALKAYQLLPPEETHSEIFKEVSQFTKNTPVSDDRTLVIVSIS